MEYRLFWRFCPGESGKGTRYKTMESVRAAEELRVSSFLRDTNALCGMKKISGRVLLGKSNLVRGVLRCFKLKDARIHSWHMRAIQYGFGRHVSVSQWDRASVPDPCPMLPSQHDPSPKQLHFLFPKLHTSPQKTNSPQQSLSANVHPPRLPNA